MIEKKKSWSSWAYDHSDHEHPKYDTLAHSLIMTLKGTLIYVFVALLIRYKFYEVDSYPLHWSAPYIGVFLLVYLAFMISSRYFQSGCPAIYESLWACNQSILMAGIGCLTGDSFLIRTTLVVVSVDQLLWYAFTYIGTLIYLATFSNVNSMQELLSISFGHKLLGFVLPQHSITSGFCLCASLSFILLPSTQHSVSKFMFFLVFLA